MKIDWRTSFLDRHLDVKFWKEMELDQSVVGVNSNLTKNAGTNHWHEQHFLMIDYDDHLSLMNLITEINRLQEKFRLPTAHIFESSYNHYNVMFFGACRDYFECLKVIHDTPCCQQFKFWRMSRQEMTLRLTPKNKYDRSPHLVHVVKSFIGDYDENIKDNFIIKKEMDRIRNFVLEVSKN